MNDYREATRETRDSRSLTACLSSALKIVHAAGFRTIRESMQYISRGLNSWKHFQARHAKLTGSPKLELVRERRTLTLQFGDAIQSQMLLSNPSILMLTYTRAMTAFTLFHHTPENIVMIGLGGGSLAKWCRESLPFARINVIEINQDIVDLRSVFNIPSDDDFFKVTLGDGAEYVALTSERPDVLLVDGFDFDGAVSPQTCTQTFYDDCFRILADDGVLVVNVVGRHDELIDRIRTVFSNRIMVATAADGENRIIFAVKGKIRPVEDETSDSLAQRFQADFTYVATQILR